MLGLIFFLLQITDLAFGAETPINLLSPELDESHLRLKERELPARFNECHLCHTKKARIFVKKARKTEMEHAEISPVHGKRNLSCNACHDVNNHNYLISRKSLPANFESSSPVCGSCHRERFRDWKRGLHGKRLGGWIQPTVQYNCIDCHHPHSVSFPKMEARNTPVLTPQVIRPNHTEGWRSEEE